MNTSKFNIGDVVSFTGNRGLNVAKINAIIFTIDGETEYFFDGYDDYFKCEEDLTLYTGSKEQTTVKEENTPLPSSWEEVKEYVKNNPQYRARWIDIRDIIDVTSDNAPKETWQHISFMKLILLRDIYRQGWEPDWLEEDCKYTIFFCENKINRGGITFQIHYPLSFPSFEIRELFYNNFTDLLQDCKDFI